MKRKKGFTLLELIIVVIVIGILASIALPRYIRMVEKARSAEARQILGAIRSSQIRHFAATGNYSSTLEALDIEYTDLQYFSAPSVANDPFEFATIQRISGPFGLYIGRIGETGNISWDGCNPPDDSCLFLY